MARPLRHLPHRTRVPDLRPWCASAVVRAAAVLACAASPACMAQDAAATAGTTAEAGGSPSPTAPQPWSVEARWRADGPQANGRGPLAQAHALQPDIAPAADASTLAELELRGSWALSRLTPAPLAQGLSLGADLLAWQQGSEGGHGRGGLRVHELQLSKDAGAWQATAGKKVVEWDVGYGFRPNDTVQRLARRSLLATPAEGRPLLLLEHYGAEDAASLVWVNPQRHSRPLESAPAAEESALNARWYRRLGELDAHLFARAARHTGGGAGAAFAWVAGDSLALHASLRWDAHHRGWASTLADSASGTLTATTPWQPTRLGAARQALVGAQWTGEAQQSLLLEAWYDGQAPGDADWRAWAQRNQALPMASVPGWPAAAQDTARAGNLAWQATPLDLPNLRRRNLYARLAWQPPGWQLSLDALRQPADGGRIVTAAAQWQGDVWRLNAAWRVLGGPDTALLAQLPTRQTALLAATRSF